jgi:ribosomal protein S18 acetylase RimI-like enzyme
MLCALFSADFRAAMNTVIRNVTAADLDRCYAIETVAYEGDEAATREKIATRIATWPEGFIVAEVEGVVAGSSIPARRLTCRCPTRRSRN